MAAILNPPFWIFYFWPRNRNQWPWNPRYIKFCAIWINIEFSQKWSPYWIRHFELLIFDLGIVISDLQTPLMNFCAIWTINIEFSQKWSPYWIRHFEFLTFDLEIVISDLKNPIIFIFAQFKRKTILNFPFLTSES